MATLGPYREKRDFNATAEPRGRKARTRGNRYVIQKHNARRLHYDLRLELDGVLKSWAVTKGPSLVAGEKRLAVHVEDHPLSYAGFEGAIPKGEYGGGEVIVWDEGSWRPLSDPHKALEKGHIEFELLGVKLRGRWHLIRMHGREGDVKGNWLLIKGEDDAARTAGDSDILKDRPESVQSGRMVEEIAEPNRKGKTPRRPPPKPDPQYKASDSEPREHILRLGDVKGAVRDKLPAFVEPALADLKASPPGGAQWVHEIKFDGYRLQARIEAGRVKLLTRSGLDWSGKFGRPILEALRALPVGKALIDGEVVVEGDSGASDFSALQSDLSEGHAHRFVYYAFDLLHLEGFDLRSVGLLERKSLLAQLLEGCSGVLRYSEHFPAAGDIVLQHACRLSLEGVVSKQKNAPYVSGRAGQWIKSKCSSRQEFVVAGYVPSSVSGRMIGSLVLGVHEKKKLVHVGRVGTGFSARVAEELRRKLEKLSTSENPFAKPLTREEASQVRYVRPTLVAEVEFRGWTAEGQLRHASFRGLREDKDATEIIREMPVENGGRKTDLTRGVRLTHPDRVYWPDTGFTKQALLDFYAEIWRLIAPFIVNRPLALLRAPEGIGEQMFFQKHAWKGMNRDIATIVDPTESSDDPYVHIRDFEGLSGLIQGATLEIHPWGSTLNDWEHPDMITLDMDPGEGVGWDAIVAAAKEAAERLRQAGLAAFVKTSGGKGLHVVAPLKPTAGWEEAKAFTKQIADSMAGDSPRQYVSTINKAKRKGKILVDYLRNQRGMTAVAAYSTRARPGVPVSMPVEWNEIDLLSGAAHFTALNSMNRLSSIARDPWEDFWRSAAPLKINHKRKTSRR